MAKRTIKGRLIAAILAHGGQEIKVTSKTVTMKMIGNSTNYLFVGKSGSLRIGPNKSQSVPVPEKQKAAYLAEQTP